MASGWAGSPVLHHHVEIDDMFLGRPWHREYIVRTLPHAEREALVEQDCRHLGARIRACLDDCLGPEPPFKLLESA